MEPTAKPVGQFWFPATNINKLFASQLFYSLALFPAVASRTSQSLRNIVIKSVEPASFDPIWAAAVSGGGQLSGSKQQQGEPAIQPACKPTNQLGQPSVGRTRPFMQNQTPLPPDTSRAAPLRPQTINTRAWRPERALLAKLPSSDRCDT